MRDLHSHILPGIDLNIKDINDTIAILNNAKENGITDIMLTPYFKSIDDENYSLKNVKDAFKLVKAEAKKLGINVYLGNEVNVNNDLVSLLKNKEILTLNNSKYLLIDIPKDVKFDKVKNKLYELLELGYIPIISHPENHIDHYKDVDYFIKLRTHGILILINYSSLFWRYGIKARKMAKMLLKSNLVSFIGSDVHGDNEKVYEFNKRTMNRISKYVGENKMQDLAINNFMKVVNNEIV